jgi:anti-anti-sigma factor
MKPALSIKAVRDGPVSTVTLRGDLDTCAVSELLIQAASAVDNQTERLVLDLAALTFLDCAGARALAMAASFAPAGCPVIIRSLSPRAARVLDLLGLDLENSWEAAQDQEPPRGEPAAGRPARAAATPNRIGHWQPGA